tara:strand:- start:316 stop:495 length:180 start_codon:yes stop_codon:yes gene_type:complete
MVEPMDTHFLAMGCLIANGIPKLGEACSYYAIHLEHIQRVQSFGVEGLVLIVVCLAIES